MSMSLLHTPVILVHSNLIVSHSNIYCAFCKMTFTFCVQYSSLHFLILNGSTNLACFVGSKTPHYLDLSDSQSLLGMLSLGHSPSDLNFMCPLYI